MTKKIIHTSILIFYIILTASNAYSKTYKIGCVEDYYPYSNIDNNGQLQGIIIDWWNLWSLKTGVDIEFVPLDIQGCLEQAKNGKIDIIAGVFYSDDWAEYLSFSEPLIRMQAVLFLKNTIKADSIPNIENKIAIVENSSSYLYLVENYPHIELNTFKSYALLFNAIYLNNVDGFIYDIPKPLGNYKPLTPPSGYYQFELLFTERLRSAVKKGNNELLNLITAGTAKITDEELFEIADKWKLLKKDRTALWWGLGIGGILLLIIAFLFFRLTRYKRKRKLMADIESKTDWQVIISKGENDLIEFKSSLRWDYKLSKMNKILESVIVKTISAFLNTEGGMLFIGVDDDGNALGLDYDYSCLSKKNSDGFLLTLTNLVNQKLGKDIHKFITISIISLNEKDVCIVNVEKSDRPIFIGKSENEKFYIRASASSQPLAMQEAYNYINSHWEK
ncbi:MAG: transporter substrate-binding domain-containing protein [Draconibacterium sp.]|nr:transporter substrate-binding domain-containing protein [Draconibacterium sp.]